MTRPPVPLPPGLVTVIVKLPGVAVAAALMLNPYDVGEVVQGTVKLVGALAVSPVPITAPVIVVPDGSGLRFASWNKKE